MSNNLILVAKGKRFETSTKSDEPLGFLTSIAKTMEVADANIGASDRPRVPSVLSPAYSFYIALTDKVENDAARVRAQKELRGLAALLILRNLLQVKVQPQTWDFKSKNAYASYFKILYQNEVGYNQSWWRDAVRYLEVEINGKWSPLCLLSPLTLVCPTVSPPPAISGVFWYDGKGNWDDPFGAPCDNAPLLAMICGNLRAWLDQTRDANFHTELVAALGSDDFASGLIDKFFKPWREAAGDYDPAAITISAAANGLFGSKILPVLDRAIAAADRPGSSRIAGGTVINLKPFFLDKLYRLSERRLDDPWMALTRGAKGAESLLLPFKPEILNHLTAERIFDSGTPPWNLTEQGSSQSVTLTVEGITHSETFSTQPDNTFTSRNFDVRIWPNRHEHQGTYFFRIKQDVSWNLQVSLICKDSKQGLVENELIDGAVETGWKPDGAACPLQRAKFYTYAACNGEPVGLIFKGRGLLFFKWNKSAGHEQRAGARLGVDFGTTHSCICINETGEPEPLIFRKLTSVLHKVPSYQYENPVRDEGATAVLDFPFNHKNWERDKENAPTDAEEGVTSQAYFPSMLTLWAPNVETNVRKTDREFKLRYGLIFPRNCYLAGDELGTLLHQYPLDLRHIPVVPTTRDFHLVPDLKWRNRLHRLAFLQHLQKLISCELAARDRTIDSIAFSFPRAFDKTIQDAFKAECEEVFGMKPEHISEGEAVLRKVCWQNKDVRFNSDRLILDVGGGTTDLLFTPLGSPTGNTVQASYEFAGGFANDYFAASDMLRKWFFSKVMGEEDVLSRWAGAHGEYSKQLFFGILSKIGAGKNFAALSPPRLDVDKDNVLKASGKDGKEAVFGFYYTIILLFAGMSYMGGRLMRTAKKTPTNLQVDLIGNGANFYTMLPQSDPSAGELGFDAVMNAVFETASGFSLRPKGFAVRAANVRANSSNASAKADASETEITWARESDSKKWVAEGLSLQSQRKNDGSILLGGSVPVPPFSIPSLNEVSGRSANEPLYDLGRQMDELKGFLDILHKSLPKGKIKGDERVALPFADEIPDGFQEALFYNMQERLKEALRGAQVDYQKALNQGVEEVSQSREPGFVVTLTEYILAVRRMYARNTKKPE